MITSLQLPFHFEPELLKAELDLIPPGEWIDQFNQSIYEGNWSGVALRSVAGRPMQLYPDPTATGPLEHRARRRSRLSGRTRAAAWPASSAAWTTPPLRAAPARRVTATSPTAATPSKYVLSTPWAMSTPTPASYTWVIDSGPPDTTIDSHRPIPATAARQPSPSAARTAGVAWQFPVQPRQRLTCNLHQPAELQQPGRRQPHL